MISCFPVLSTRQWQGTCRRRNDYQRCLVDRALKAGGQGKTRLRLAVMETKRLGHTDQLYLGPPVGVLEKRIVEVVRSKKPALGGC